MLYQYQIAFTTFIHYHETLGQLAKRWLPALDFLKSQCRIVCRFYKELRNYVLLKYELQHYQTKIHSKMHVKIIHTCILFEVKRVKCFLWALCLQFIWSDHRLLCGRSNSKSLRDLCLCHETYTYTYEHVYVQISKKTCLGTRNGPQSGNASCKTTPYGWCRKWKASRGILY